MFFFFQAEDGIRDIGVTGVQTCALPILRENRNQPHTRHAGAVAFAPGAALWGSDPGGPSVLVASGEGQAAEIGRASCRERVQISVVAVSLKKTPPTSITRSRPPRRLPSP